MYGFSNVLIEDSQHIFFSEFIFTTETQRAQRKEIVILLQHGSE